MANFGFPAAAAAAVSTAAVVSTAAAVSATGASVSTTATVSAATVVSELSLEQPAAISESVRRAPTRNVRRDRSNGGVVMIANVVERCRQMSSRASTLHIAETHSPGFLALPDAGPVN